MTYYAGLDVSLKEISICVVDNDGEVVMHGTAPADPVGVAGWFKTGLWNLSGSRMKVASFRFGERM